MPTTTRTIFLKNPVPKQVNFAYGADDSTFEIKTVPIPTLRPGQVLVKVIILLNDPTQRAWIQKGIDPARMYVPPVYKGEAMRSSGLCQVVESNNPKYPRGTVLNATVTWLDYCVIGENHIFNAITDHLFPITTYLDTLGLTGVTALFGITEVARVNKDLVIVISAASGATGSVAVQIAKHVVGCRKVIGISGGPDKCRWVELIGADICVDYRAKDFRKQMRAAIGEGKFADCYFDSVGGSILDTMLLLVKPFGTIVACGAIAGYNDIKKSMIVNWPQIITNRLTVRGFIVTDYQKRFPEAVERLRGYVKEGKLKVGDDSFTLVDKTKDFEGIPTAWSLLFDPAKGVGKLLTRVAHEEVARTRL